MKYVSLSYIKYFHKLATINNYSPFYFFIFTYVFLIVKFNYFHTTCFPFTIIYQITIFFFFETIIMYSSTQIFFIEHKQTYQTLQLIHKPINSR